MKKYLFPIIALAVSAFIGSCEKELTESEAGAEAQKPGTVNLTITAGAPESKTFMEVEGGNYVPKWSASDKIGVFFDDWTATAADADATLTNGAAGETATFTGSVSVDAGDHTVYAFYPARAFYGTAANKILYLEIPEIQFPAATSFDPKADLLVSVPQSLSVSGTEAAVENMQFRRIGAILKVSLIDQSGVLTGDKIKSVKLESSTSYLSGKFSYDFENEDAAATQMVAESSAKSVTADFSGSPIDLDKAIHFIVNPTTLASGTGLTITVLTDKHEVVKTINSLQDDIVLPSSTVKTLGITLNNTCTITRVYFQDNFDWIANYWDIVSNSPSDYSTAYKRVQYNLDPVSAQSVDESTNYNQPNVWLNNKTTFGADFKKRGYVDLAESNNAMYLQENYLKFGKTDKHSGIELPLLNIGDVPVNVTLSFDWSVQDRNKDFIVEVLNRGTCADSGIATSNTFKQTTALNWETKTITLVGLTSVSRICIKPNVSSYTVSGKYRWFLRKIRITEAASTPAPFPVQWSFLPPAQLTKEVDYHLEGSCLTGTFLYSDNHYGRIFIRRAAGAGQVTDTGTPKNPTYTVRGTGDAFEGYTQLLTYGIGKGSAFEFEIYNVDNPAGTYTIDFNITASGGGAKYFGIQYSTDGGANWSASQGVEGQTPTKANGSTNVDYSFALAGTNIRKDVQKTFHLGAVQCDKLLIRAVAVSSINQNATPGDTGTNTTATCRIFAADSADDATSKVYVDFTPDSSN